MVKEDVGMTFAAALRSMLRQAPNIIMIGEIRDMETAGIAINASLTGHLVFSTLHTNDAPSAVARLADIGIKPFLISSAVRSIMAQRLVRKLCGDCKTLTMPGDKELRALRIDNTQQLLARHEDPKHFFDQRQCMAGLILRLLSSDSPDTLMQVDFFPRHGHDIAFALPSQQQRQPEIPQGVLIDRIKKQSHLTGVKKPLSFARWL
jgi:hypothetical protein